MSNSIFLLFQEKVKKSPKSMFVTDSEGSYTYLDIFYKIKFLAERIKELNVGKFALFTSNNHTFIIGYLVAALLQKECIFIPQQANAFEITSIRELYPNMLWLIDKKKRTCILDIDLYYFIDEYINDYNSNNVIEDLTKTFTVDSNQVHSIIHFSSGTTGSMKNIERTENSLFQEANSIVNTLKLTSSDKIMTILPLSYSFSFGTAFLSSLYAGCSLYIYDNIFPAQVIKLLKQNNISMFLAVPFFYDLLNKSLNNKVKIDLNSVRYLISSGAKLDYTLQRKLEKKINRNINIQYGASETGALFINIEGNDNSIGIPYDGIKWNVKFDTNELMVEGRDFAINSSKIDSQTGVFHTGDLVRVRNGKLYFNKRKDKIFNLGSQKVTPEEVEIILNNLNYVKLAKVSNKKNEKIIAKVIVNKEVSALQMKNDLKKITMDFKIPSKLIIKKIKTTQNIHKKSRVAVIKCESYSVEEVYNSLIRGINLLGGISQFVKNEEKILLKPNLLSGKELVSTHPSIFEAMIQVLQESGTIVSFGDSPAFDQPSSAAKDSGLTQIADKYDVKFGDFDNGKIVKLKKYLINSDFLLANAVLEVDGVISLSKMKTHQLTRITGAIKNQYGCLVGMSKLRFHHKYSNIGDFSKMLVDLNNVIKPRLYIMDGIVAMEGNGPSNGTPIKINVLLISDDPVAIDAAFCKLINLDRAFLPTLKYGKKAGLGNFSDQEVEFLGDNIDSFINNNFDVVRRKISIHGDQEKMPFVGKFIYSRPIIKRENCLLCGKCVHVCPVPDKAIFMKNNKTYPIYDYKKCIKCYCCQEICPNNAIFQHKPILTVYKGRIQ